MLRITPLIILAAATTNALAANTTLLTQQRSVSALTTFDNQLQTAGAVGFEPFVVTVAAETPFPAGDGGTGTNQAVSSINCLVDPNAIRASGSLAAAGGFALVGTQPSPVFGEAGAQVVVSFRVDVPTVYHLTAAPRPSAQPGDEFELELTNLETGNELYKLDERDPAQSVDRTGLLQPGQYEVQYVVELTGDAATESADYGFNLTLSSPCGLADMGSAGGLDGSDNRLDNNDFIAFIGRFFAQSPGADVGVAGGVSGSDGQFDNNDFIVFITAFFGGDAGCF